MPPLSPWVESWLNRLKTLPRWTWGLAGLTLIGLLLIPFGLLGSERPPSASDAAGLETSSFNLVISVFLKFGVVILLIYVSLLALRKWQFGRAGGVQRQMAILETTHLSPRQALHIVRVGEKTLLIGATDQSLTCLSELAAPATNVSGEFATKLKLAQDSETPLR